MQMVAEAAYVGQHGLKLSKRVEPNRPLPAPRYTANHGAGTLPELRRHPDG